MTEKEVTRSSVRVNRTKIVDSRAAIKYIKRLSREDAHEDFVASCGENLVRNNTVETVFSYTFLYYTRNRIFYTLKRAEN